MGTPNSTIAKNALKAYLLDNVRPSIDVLCALNLDIEMLERQYAEIKPQLRYTEGFVDLENACTLIHERDRWAKEVSAAGLTGTRVLHLVAEGHTHLLSLSPVGGGSSRDLQIFLIKTGEWLVWDGGIYERVLPSFKKFKSANRLVSYLYRLAGENHEFFTWDDRFRYWAHISKSRTNARHQEVAVALVLREQLRIISSESIAVKAERLKTQRDMVSVFQGVDARAGLLPQP
jgi:hypothetical protein